MNQPKRCFVIMPFGQQGTAEYDRNLKIYQLMIKPVAENHGYEVVRGDELEHMGNITRDIIELLHECDLVIADLSGKNANVFYELGVRHAIYKSGTIPIMQKGEQLPFDIANYRAIFYSSELDGPDLFKKELARRIKAFENIGRRKPDNPVHDILGEKLSAVPGCVKEEEYSKKLNEIETLRKSKVQLEQSLKMKESEMKSVHGEKDKIITDLQGKIKELENELKKASNIPAAKSPPVDPLSQSVLKFRDKPSKLSVEEVKVMLNQHNFFDSDYNENGKGFNNDFVSDTIGNDNVVIDKASGLMWLQGGSESEMELSEAKEWVKELNSKGYAGKNDWRLPTLEEAMSLMKPEENENGLYISDLFDKRQSWIWTCDNVKGSSRAWAVYFGSGRCGGSVVCGGIFVRAVRSGQSSA